MIEKLKHITASGKVYPMALTMNVMESMQEVYGSFVNWGTSLQKDDQSEVNVKVLKWTMAEFINEGIEIENEEKSEKREPVTLKQVGRIITDIGATEAVMVIMDIAVQSNSTGEDPKNEMTK